ncbi:DNA-(apurinic or apyrimidinic site) lyase [Alteripontixanthobacter maritimus]|uniref:DNA-(Apurinic or apyrimidinic site) lyase n=1 Tax=Alteripontixanthobacter maritimus TaxID=2161824 RepID=A0A369Q766_9SPHN|nr:endonuclease III [Alteripontixanthobacter maritimus]RDC58996.1 DNA-(apurinic or apyrimidinic site) lyase [Alteripontixanthobacter maritimus]
MRSTDLVQDRHRPRRKPLTDMAQMLNETEVETVYRQLAEAMPGRTPGAKGPKGQPDAFRSCISCMLSAQSLDRNTAKAARALFALARTPEAMLDLDDRDIAAAIKPCGLYNIKTRNIRKFCEALLAEHGGVVPDTREGLLSLPGIGRKCADIVLSFTFGKDVIAVDTHVHRVCNRIGLTKAKTADKTAQQLEARTPPWALRDGHFWLIQFGKRICTSRAPKCAQCPVSDICLWYRDAAVTS